MLCIFVTMKPNSSLYKGSLKLVVLKLLEENEKMYGYAITKAAREITDGEMNITEGALYPTLHKMEAEGLLTVSMEQVGNRMRKYYRITEEGQKETKKLLAEFWGFVENMKLIFNTDVNPAGA